MTWSAFNTAVRAFLLGYNTPTDIQTYIDRQIIAGAVDLQRTVPFYRIGHEDTLAEADVVQEGSASRAPMPSGRIEAAWLRYNNVTDATSFEVTNAPLATSGPTSEDPNGVYTLNTTNGFWEKDAGRFWFYYSAGKWNWWSVLLGAVYSDSDPAGAGSLPWTQVYDRSGPVLLSPDIKVELGLTQVGGDEFRAMRGGDTDRKGRLYLDTMRGVIYVTPALNPETLLVLRWTGVKTTFPNSDEVPLDAEAAHAVSEFVLSRLARSVDKDLRQAQAHENAYIVLKRKLFGDFNARSFVGLDSRTVGYRVEAT
jgi:hypothetical protein